MERTDRIRIFCAELWRWFSVHKRTLPWRDLKIKDLSHKAYLILVSEVMLQQTQVARVIILYKKFIQTFPRMEDLAKASNREVLIAWRGMGYNSRALRLRDAARMILTRAHPHPLTPSNQEGRGIRASWKFPSAMEELQSITGIGHYTAAAIRNFAFGVPTPCLDTNIRRILHRFFVGVENADGTWRKNDTYLLKLAEQVLHVALEPPPLAPPPGPGAPGQPGEGKTRVISLPADDERAIASESSRGRDRERGRGTRTTADFHAALMDFGSLVCTNKNPKWELLPEAMKSICKAYGKGKIRTKNLFNNAAQKREPGREMAGRYVPNRIFRGRIIDALRDAPHGLTIDQLGKAAIADWPAGHSLDCSSSLSDPGVEDRPKPERRSGDGRTMGDHRRWLDNVIQGLMRDRMIERTDQKFSLPT